MEGQRVYPTVTWSLRQTLGAIRQMPILFALTVFAAVVLQVVLLTTLPLDVTQWGLNDLLLSVIQSALNALALTPMIIATHRLVILGEVTKLFSLHVFSPRFVHFLFLSFVFQAIMLGILLPPALLGFHALPVIAAIILFFCAIWIGSRILIVFPAIATDAPGASLHNAFADSQGEAGGIFGILFVIGLLLALINLAITLVIEGIVATGAAAVGGWLLILERAAFQVVTVMAFAAAASHIYLGLADRLNPAPVES